MAADPREPHRARRWLPHVYALIIAFAVFVAPLPELPFVRLVLEEFTGSVRDSKTEPERPLPVAVINFALEPGPCNAQSSATGRTSSICVAQVLNQANAVGAKLAVLDLYIPARSGHGEPVSRADAALVAAIQRSGIPVLILRQPTNSGDGINRPLQLVPNIFDDVSAPQLYRATSLLHAEREGLNRFAEGYRTASGEFVPSVPFAVHRLVHPEARPRRILTGDKRPFRATTLPIAEGPDPVSLGENPSAAIVEVAPSQVTQPALRGRVWLIGNAYRGDASDRDRDRHPAGKEGSESGLILMARAVSAGDVMDADAITGPWVWRLWVLGIGVLILGADAGREAAFHKLGVKVPKVLNLPMTLVVVWLFSRALIAGLRALPGIAPWQAADLVLDGVYLAALTILMAELVVPAIIALASRARRRGQKRKTA